ncbi:MAG: hypothetical protein ABH846_04930 [Patescibacteria group bacterium]
MPTKSRTKTHAKTKIKTSTKVIVAVSAIVTAAFALAAFGGVIKVVPGLTVINSRPPTSQTIVRGQNDVAMLGMEFVARRIDVDVESIAFKFTGDDNAAMPLDNDIRAQDVISSCILKDSQTGALISGPESLDANDMISFDDNFSVFMGVRFKAILECDIFNVATTSGDPDFFTFDIAASTDISAMDANTGDLLIGRAITLGKYARGINPNGKNIKITKVDNGVLSVNTPGASPNSQIIVPNDQDVKVAQYRFDAQYESMLINRLTFSNCVTTVVDDNGNCADLGENRGSDQAADAITIEYPDINGNLVTKTSLFNNGEVTFDLVNYFYVPADDNAELSVYVDGPSGIGLYGPDSGDDFQVNFNAVTGGFRAIGQTSGNVLDETDLNAYRNANHMRIHASKPTISLAAGSPSGAFIPGVQEVFRFNVSADASRTISFDEILFNLSTSDNARTGWNTCSQLGDAAKFDFYNLTVGGPADLLDSDADWVMNDGLMECANGSTMLGNARLNLSTPENVPAGVTYTYALYMDTTGASSADDDAIRVDIPQLPPFNPFIWTDGYMQDISAYLLKNLPVSGGTLVF